MTARRLPLLLALALALAALAALPAAAPAKTVWLCGPGVKDDPCRPSLTTTVVTTWSGPGRVVRHRAPKRPALDCFYVYPTVSNQKATVATRRIDPELRSIALLQAARFSEVCRVWAPVYRQITIQGLNRGDATAKQRALAYGDVLAAWREYRAHAGRGRGVVLIGHSQGAGHLQRLLREQVDTRPAVRRRLVSAILLGGNVVVPRAQDVGGVFRNIPACRTPGQLGCVIAYSAFAETPPENSLFGRFSSGFANAFGLPADGDFEVLCTNPAQLAGGDADVPIDPVLPTEAFAPSYYGAGILLAKFPLPPARTPWVEAPGAFSARCTNAAGANVLLLTPAAGTPVPRPTPTPGWGLHVFDVNLTLGDLVRVVAREGRAYVVAAAPR